jgi:hypothetical protein
MATMLLVMGMIQFSFLTDLELVDTYREGRDLSKLELLGPRLGTFLIWTKVLPLIGLAISGMIIFQLTRKTKHYWANLSAVLLLAFLAIRLELLTSRFIKAVTLSLGNLFSDFGSAYPLLINGVVLIGLGLLIFYFVRDNALRRKIEKAENFQ